MDENKQEQGQQNTDIGQEVRTFIGDQVMNIISLNKQINELRQMCTALENENKQLKEPKTKPETTDESDLPK